MKKSNFLVISIILNIVYFLIAYFQEFAIASLIDLIMSPLMSFFLLTVGFNAVAFYRSDKHVDSAIMFTILTAVILALRALITIMPFAFHGRLDNFPWHLKLIAIAVWLQPLLNIIAIIEMKIKQKAQKKNITEDEVL